MVCVALLGACSTQRPPEFVRELPPAALLQDCPAVTEQHATNGQLAATILEYRKALGSCNLDKASLRKWADRL